MGENLRMKKLIFDFANCFLVLIILNIILHYIIPIKQIIFFPYNYIGILLFIFGWIPNIWQGITIGLNSASQIPKKLINTGLFRFSRNPTYLGMTITLLGEAIFLGSLITFIIPILFVILINNFNINFEEKILENKFGTKYLEYKKKVRRWI